MKNFGEAVRKLEDANIKRCIEICKKRKDTYLTKEFEILQRSKSLSPIEADMVHTFLAKVNEKVV
jgi:hypothetical protein